MKEIPLSQGLVALVDDEDAASVLNAGQWHATSKGGAFYARRNYWVDGRCRTIRLHTFLTGWPIVDHINGDGLDCRRKNLRPATSTQNSQNRGIRSDNRTGFKGVSWHQHNGAWVARIQAAGRRLWLGSFADPIEAARAYDAAATEHYGAFARLNFPKGSAG